MSQLSQFLSARLLPVESEPVESISWNAGTTERVDQETYDEKLEILPPRWIRGNAFAFGEGSGPFSIFWQQDADSFFVRHLDGDETDEFCKLAGVRLHQ